MKHKILKKIIGLFGYKLIEKNTFKNERLISNNSFLKIDKLLKVLFFKKKISNLIQIGANDGERFDLLNPFIKKYPCKSLLVEPIKRNFERLKNNYKDNNNIIFENSAISINNDIQKLYKVDDKFLSYYSNHIPGITSFDKKHLIKHGVRSRHIVTENVATINMKDLINKHNFHSIELLCIDAEGYDGKIAIDFLETTSIRPVIILEYIHIKNDTLIDLFTVLEEKKYNIFTISENLICYAEADKKFIKFI